MKTSCDWPAFLMNAWPWSEAADIVILGILLAWASMLGLKRNVCYVESPMSGLCSATVIFTTWQTLLLKSTKSDSSCQSGGKHCACMYESVTYVQVGGRTPLHMLLSSQHWVSFRMLAEECYQTTNMWMLTSFNKCKDSKTLQIWKLREEVVQSTSIIKQSMYLQNGRRWQGDGQGAVFSRQNGGDELHGTRAIEEHILLCQQEGPYIDVTAIRL